MLELFERRSEVWLVSMGNPWPELGAVRRGP